MLASIWNNQDSFHVLIRIIHSPKKKKKLLCLVLMHISLYYNMLQNILPYIIIESKLQHVSLEIYIYIYIYTYICIYIDFFTYIRYTTPYYNVITLFWDEFVTITYKSQVQLKSPPLPIFFIKKKVSSTIVIFNFTTKKKKKKIVMSNFPAHCVGLRLVYINKQSLEKVQLEFNFAPYV